MIPGKFYDFSIFSFGQTVKIAENLTQRKFPAKWYVMFVHEHKIHQVLRYASSLEAVVSEPLDKKLSKQHDSLSSSLPACCLPNHSQIEDKGTECLRT